MPWLRVRLPFAHPRLSRLSPLTLPAGSLQTGVLVVRARTLFPPRRGKGECAHRRQIPGEAAMRWQSLPRRAPHWSSDPSPPSPLSCRFRERVQRTDQLDSLPEAWPCPRIFPASEARLPRLAAWLLSWSWPIARRRSGRSARSFLTAFRPDGRALALPPAGRQARIPGGSPSLRARPWLHRSKADRLHAPRACHR